MNLSDSDNTDFLSTLISSVSTRELQSIKKRVDFYFAHYMAINKKQDKSRSYNNKINSLSGFNSLLEQEISNRTVV